MSEDRSHQMLFVGFLVVLFGLFFYTAQYTYRVSDVSYSSRDKVLARKMLPIVIPGVVVLLVVLFIIVLTNRIQALQTDVLVGIFWGLATSLLIMVMQIIYLNSTR